MTTDTSSGKIGVLQYLDQDGRMTAAADGFEWGRPLATDLYRSMRLTRILDETFVNLQRQGQLALYPPCRGQEAVQVGTASALLAQDWVFPSYRELGVFVTRGVDSVGLGQLWRGNWHGADGLLERNCAPICLPIATALPHATGHALGCRLRGTDVVTVAYLGDGATSEGDAHEAFNLAAVYRAPVVFVIQNNQWAISVPVAQQCRAETLASKGVGYGMPATRVDGNDVLASREVMLAALGRARAGGGPTLIEALTYRMEAHTTADDPSCYRSAEEVETWAQRDPIMRLERYLAGQGWLNEVSDDIDTMCRDESNRLRAGLYEAPHGDPMELFAHVQTAMSAKLCAQAQQLWSRIDTSAR